MVLTYFKMDSESTDYVFRKINLDNILRENLLVIEQILSNALKYTNKGSVTTRIERWASLKSLAGGVLFLAIVISAVFIFVATLILYYKQISEGYEDQRQFSIMRKIGMTKKEILRSINSQMLMAF